MTPLNVTPGMPVVLTNQGQPDTPAVVKSVWANGVFSLEGDGRQTYRPDGTQRGSGYHRPMVRPYGPGETAESIIARNLAQRAAAEEREAARIAALDAAGAAALRVNPDFKTGLARIPATMIYFAQVFSRTTKLYAITFNVDEREERGWEADAQPQIVYEIAFAFASLSAERFPGWSSATVKGYTLDQALGRMLASLG